MPQYAILIYVGDSAHSEEATREGSDREEVEDCDRHADELNQAGVMTLAYALRPRDTARSVRRDVVEDGPFVDAEHVVAGFCIIEAPDLDAAVEFARSNPASPNGGGAEVRPVAEGGLISPTQTGSSQLRV